MSYYNISYIFECEKPMKITKFGSLNVTLSLSLEFNVWSGWINRNGTGYIRNRTCEKNDGKSKVEVDSAKCNGSDFEIIGNELLVLLYKKIAFLRKIILNTKLDFKSKHSSSATLVIRT